MDDESYFSLSNSAIPHNQYYYARSGGDAPDAQRYVTQQKFQQKILVWLAISDRGISKPFFAPSKQAVNQQIYSKDCVEKRLAPFLAEHHSDGNYLFWPDLASSHYAGSTLAKFDELGIQFVAKELNPPNVPQLRPIEDFWGWLKQEVYRQDWRAESLDQLKRRIQYCLGKVDVEDVQNMMGQIKRNLRVAKEHGVQSAYH